MGVGNYLNDHIEMNNIAASTAAQLSIQTEALTRSTRVRTMDKMMDSASGRCTSGILEGSILAGSERWCGPAHKTFMP